MMSSSVRTEVCTTLDGLGAQWDRIVEETRASPFLRSWWLDAIAHVATRTVLVLDAGDTLLGGMPFEIERRGRRAVLCVAGTRLGPDHLDVVAVPEHRDVVLQQVGAWIRRGAVRVFDLGGIAEHSRIDAVLPGRVTRRLGPRAPWGRVPDTFDEYWRQRPSQLRNTVDRAQRRLRREGVRYQVLPASEAAVAIGDFARLHELRWHDASGVAPFFDTFEKAVAAGLRNGGIVAHRLVRDDDAIAIELWFELGGVASFYQSGRDLDPRWRGAGSVLKYEAIARAVGWGATEIDLLGGDEAYKHDWVDLARTNVGLTTTPGPVRRLAKRVRRRVRSHGRRSR